MKTIIGMLSCLILAQAATILPVDQSIVNVKSERNGQDYSYSIQENRGLAVEPIIHALPHAIPAIPIIKTTHEVHHGEQPHHAEQQHHEKEQEKPHHELKNQQINELKPQAKELALTSLPLLQYPQFYNYLPAAYPTAYHYAYTYPYAYHLNYNLIPIKAD